MRREVDEHGGREDGSLLDCVKPHGGVRGPRAQEEHADAEGDAEAAGSLEQKRSINPLSGSVFHFPYLSDLRQVEVSLDGGDVDRTHVRGHLVPPGQQPCQVEPGSARLAHQAGGLASV